MKEAVHTASFFNRYQQMKIFSTSLLLLALLFAGCNMSPKDFNLVFKLENLNIYNLSIEINGDKSYNIKQQNLFFDSHAKKAQINGSEGKMDDKEFKKLTEIISSSRLFEKENSYGFNKDSNITNDLLEGLNYRLNYTEGGKTKYIMIHPNLRNNDNPDDISRLIKFLIDFSSAHLKK